MSTPLAVTLLIFESAILTALLLFVGPLYANYRRVRSRNHKLRDNLANYAEEEKKLRDSQMAGMKQAQEAFAAQNNQIVELNRWLRGHYTEDELAGHTWLEFVKAKLGEGKP